MFRLTALVKGVSSGRVFCCGVLDFNSQLQSVVNVSADSNVISFNVWKEIVGAKPNWTRRAVDGCGFTSRGPGIESLWDASRTTI